MIRFRESNSSRRLDAAAERTLAAEVVRLLKLNPDEVVRRSVEEAARLLSEGHYSEAESLLQNAAARVSPGAAASAPPAIFSRACFDRLHSPVGTS
jgi:xanthine/CO dehydrogenase XdhC/CoxF family maturation factor